MADFGFVGAAYQAASPTQDAQECINWYPEADPTKADNPSTQENEAGRGVVALYPTPGLKLLCTPLAGVPVRGMHVIPGGQTLFAVCGSTLYSITTSYVATAVGTLATATGRVYLTDNGVGLYITDGVNRYSYLWGAGVFATMTDGPFLGGGVCDEVDNYIIYTRPGTNQWGCTNVGDIASNPLNFASKIVSADNLVSLIVVGSNPMLLGEQTSEMWQDSGTFPFPFQVIPGTSTQHGLAAKDSVARLGESFACLAADDRGRNVVVQFNSWQPKRISTFAIEQAINGYSTTSDAIGMSYQQAGHEFYLLTFPTADVTWCYDLATQLWHKRAYRDANNVLHRHRANCLVPFNQKVLVGDWQNGHIYAFDQSVFTELEAPIARVRSCQHLTSDLKYLFFSELQLQFQPGVGIANGQGSNPQAILDWSDDGGFTYGNQHMAPIGKMGQYKNRCRWQRLGSARDRIFRVTVTDPVYAVIVSANLRAEAGAT